MKTSGPWVKTGGKTAKSRFLALLRSGRCEAAMGRYEGANSRAA